MSISILMTHVWVGVWMGMEPGDCGLLWYQVQMSPEVLGSRTYKVGLRGWPTNTRGPLTVDSLAWACQTFVWYRGLSPYHAIAFCARSHVSFPIGEMEIEFGAS